jgi:DNA-binding transcriptional ArsR family regulator
MAKGSAVLEALADPTRRAIVDALRRGPLAVSELAQRLPVSQSAVSQHLKVLSELKIVAHEAKGTRRHYSLRPEALGELRAYVTDLWDDALSAFAREAKRQQSATKRGQR